MIANESGGCKVHELRAGNLGIERPIEYGEFLDLSDPGLFEAPGEEPIGAPGELVLHEQVEKLEGLERSGFRLF
jgi:hypothetical protein